MTKIPKMAPPGLDNRKPSPFIRWLRDALLKVKRDPTKASLPPGVPIPDNTFHSHIRFPNTQSCRSIEPAMAQGGVHHKLADNYYFDRDQRREVLPPKPIYEAIGEAPLWQKPSGGQTLTTEQVTKNFYASVSRGPSQNFGFGVPTPGSGYEWKRNSDAEEYTQKKNPELAKLEKYDKYLKE